MQENDAKPKTIAEKLSTLLRFPTVEVSLVIGNDPSPVSEMEGPAFSRVRQAVERVWPGALTLPALMEDATDACHYSAFIVPGA
jgi:carboxypeptidase PM20D1